MSLRTRLVISFTVLLLVVIGVIGLIASRAVDTIMVRQIDRTLMGFASRGPDVVRFGVPGVEVPQGTMVMLAPTAELLVDQDGNVLVSRPSGFSDQPNPLPDVSDLPDTNEPFTVPSVDDSMDYRAIAFTVPEQLTAPDVLTLVVAAPLTEVADATSSLIRALAIAGVAVLALGGVATWWTVKRAMRPVDQMVDTAEAIASGDLTRRVPELEPGTELGRLGDSLNEMLTHIEEAVETEKEGQQLLRRFIADASHELRTPVTAISGYAELRKKGGLATAEEENKAWSRIESEGHRMGALIEDLVALTRLGKGQQLHLSQVDLVQVADNAAHDHRVIAPDRPVDVSAPSTLVIPGDEDRLLQVVTSLLSNVRVHTPSATTTTITLSEGEGNAVIEVADDGPGFPPASIAHVFDRFYRADPSRSRRSGGSGLGLAIVEAIVTAHGGTVSASNVEGGGARVTVILPQSRLHRPQI